MKIVHATDYEEMSRRAAALLAAQVLQKPNAVLGLATGSSPIGLYEHLVRWYAQGDLDFSQVKTVNLDEYRGLPRGHEQSYYHFMFEHLFSHINIDPANVNLPDGTQEDASAECARYDRVIADLGGIDMQLLGLGLDGHIGFNEPGEVFARGTHCENLTESTIQANKRFFASADEVPRQAYTMGIGNIMQAKRIVVVVNGANKADILRQVVEGPVTPKVPGSILQLHRNVTIVADAAAARELK